MRTVVVPFVMLFAAAGCQVPEGSSLHGDVVLPPAGQVRVARQAVTNGDGPNGAHIIFLNFDGATLKSGWDNSATDTSQIPKTTVKFPAFDPSPYTGSMTAAQVKDNITQKMVTYFSQVNAQIVNV